MDPSSCMNNIAMSSSAAKMILILLSLFNEGAGCTGIYKKKVCKYHTA